MTEQDGVTTRMVTRKELIVRGLENQARSGPLKNTFVSRACDRYNEAMEREFDIKETSRDTDKFKAVMKTKVRQLAC